MTTQIQRRRGTTAQHSTFTGAVGEVTVDTDKEVLVVHDGAQVGGYPQMRENGSNSALALGSAGTPSLKFTGDTNTGIYSPGADQVAISTNGTGRLFVDSSGRVGIGTNSPDRTLHLAGPNGVGIHYKNTSTTGDLYATLEASDEFRFNIGGNGYYTWFATGSERLRITSDGKVGLGTSSPTSALTVAGDVAVGGTGNIGIRFHSASPTAASLRWLLANDQGNSDKLTLYRYDSGGNFAAQVLAVDTSNRVGVGTTPSERFHVSGGNSRFEGNYVSFNNNGYIRTDAANELRLQMGSSGTVFSNSGNTEIGRWDSSGRLLVGTSTAESFPSGGTGRTPRFQVKGDTTDNGSISITRTQTLPICFLNAGASGTNVNSNDTLGRILFNGYHTSSYYEGAYIEAAVDGTPGAGDMPTRLVFSTTADGASSPTERVRINSSGDILVDGSAVPSAGAGAYVALRGGDNTCISTRRAGTANREHIAFFNGNGQVGTISSSGTTTAYNTSSDYRLKENVTAVTDGITRLQQLKPSRFNFIADPTKTVDGFLAHEVQDIVPEAITGTKDEVDADGNPIYQGIDQSKLVPLLTAALQEAVAKIESLEARLTAAGI